MKTKEEIWRLEVEGSDFTIMSDNSPAWVAKVNAFKTNSSGNAEFIVKACNNHYDLLNCLTHALNDLEHLKVMALNGMPGEFSIGMFKRMDDYEQAIKRSTE